MHARFYVPGPHAPGSLIRLSEEESHHSTRVLRLGAGTLVHVFDGAGHEFAGTIVDVGRKEVTVEIGEAVPPAAEARLPITLVQAVLKGDKMDDVVRDAVMLGVAAIQPVVTERTEISLVALERGARQERWQRVVVASAKQCGRAVIPPVLSPALLGRAVLAAQDTLSVMCVEPGLAAGGRSITTLPSRPPAHARLIVGPEGGWAPAEVSRAATVTSLVTLGARTLRADAMAIVALSALYTHWNEI